MAREVIVFAPSEGFPAGAGISYECLACGGVVRSMPRHEEPTECPCRNVYVDADAGRVSVTDEAQLRAFRTVFHIAYVGVGLAGKTTNLQYLHARSDAGLRTALEGRTSETERTLRFRLRSTIFPGAVFEVVTVPGAVYRHPSHRAVLEGVSGVAFVADSQRERLEANAECLAQVVADLDSHGLDLAKLACVMQYNKRDLATAMPIDELERALNARGVPHVAAVASMGEGVFATLRALGEQLEAARAL